MLADLPPSSGHTFKYDPFDRRIQKSGPNGTDLIPSFRTRLSMISAKVIGTIFGVRVDLPCVPKLSVSRTRER